MATVDVSMAAKIDELEKRMDFVERFLELASAEDEADADPIELRHRENLARLRDQ